MWLKTGLWSLRWQDRFSVSHFFLNLTQGDQIGRIFALSATVFFGRFCENYKSSQHFCSVYFTPNRRLFNWLFWPKNGHSLCDFFHKLIWSSWCGSLK
jgi:hypothetical protein